MSADWQQLRQFGESCLEAVRPYGVVPIVTIVLAALAIAGLVMQADPFGVIAVVVICLIVTIYGQERWFAWKRDELREEYDHEKETVGRQVQRKARRRIDAIRRQNQPDLFPPNGESK